LFFCRECGYVASCPNCNVSLTYHSQKQLLCCHYCGFRQDVFHNCPECGSRYIRFYGQGTQKVEEETAALFPGVEVLRLDTDSAAEKHREILDRFRRQEAPILVGTQMLSKGLDFPNVTLVGVISADQLLNMPDFRSRERAFQLLTQVAGRAGRADKPGEVIIQTYSPDDRAILQAARHDYDRFFWEEIAYRKERGYPPFAHIIRIMVYHEKEDRVIRAAQVLTDCIRRVKEAEPEVCRVLGPAPAVMTKLKNQFRWQVSVKGKSPEILRRIIHKGVKDFYSESASSGINLSIEVNPLNI
jgi:primosomal protein N' (replication factor Y)